MDDVSCSGDRPIALAILAMDDEIGGTLADWIVATAQRDGWSATTASVADAVPGGEGRLRYVDLSRKPANLPSARGAVDVVVAAGLTEAGTAIRLGLVVPERTVVVAATHSAVTVPQKARLDDAAIGGRPVLEVLHFESRELFVADMESSGEPERGDAAALLFGELAASGALPFAVGVFETTIREGRNSVAISLAGFEAGYRAAGTQAASGPLPAGSFAAGDTLISLLDRITSDFPAEARRMLGHGAARLADYQDTDYAQDYLDHVAKLVALEPSLAREAARYVALAMAYDDAIGAADLALRAARLTGARDQAGAGQTLEPAAFVHPRLADICELLPARLGHKVERSALLSDLMARWLRPTRRWRLLQLSLLARMRRRRRRLLRHERETEFLRNWLDLVASEAQHDPALALELLRCRRLVRGYGETRRRGENRFARVIAALPMLTGRTDAVVWLRRLREAARADAMATNETGTALDEALARLAAPEAPA